MKLRLFIFVALVLINGLVSAQNYQIRTDAKINLRSWHGTGYRIVETVSAGTVLQAVGKFNRWLKINRNGMNLWMADWVRYSVLGSDAAPSTSTETQPQHRGIDNYCFTIWKCITEAEWQRGYFAYQDNEGLPSPRQGGSRILPGGPKSLEFLGADTITTRSIHLTQGTWNVRIITAANALVYANSAAGESCWGSGLPDRVFVTWKLHNDHGGINEANGQITATKDCNASFYVWAPRHAWSLKLNKA